MKLEDAPEGTRTGPGAGVKIAAFSALVVICAGVGIGYLLYARNNNPTAGPPTEPTTADLAAVMAKPHVVFRNTEVGANYGKVEVVPLDDRNGPRAVTPLTCDRVTMQGSVGVCLTSSTGVIKTYKGEIFDANFHVTNTFPLAGIPSRVRMSPDGKYAATTSFVNGDSYAQSGFSTRTEFVDIAGGNVIANLEGFDITDKGKAVTDISRNYWGVTFASDSDHFYATLAVGTKIQMIEGDAQKRSGETVADDVECPSLSPDQTRVAYKKRVGGGFSAVKWRLHVYNLQTHTDVALAETRSVDDQVAWADDSTVLYGLPRSTGSTAFDTFAVPADGSGAPTLYVPGAWSATVAPAQHS